MTHSTSLSGYFPDDDEELDPPFPPTSTDLLGYTDPADIVVSSVEARSITDELKLLFDQFHTFRDVEYYGAANKVFNAQMFFERLALPLRIYDEKIEERSLEGEIYLPKTSAEYLEELRDHRIDGGGGSLLESTKAVEALRDFLWDSCPMFDEIVATIDESVQEGDSVAVFNGSKKTGELLSEALYDESGVDAELLDEHLRVVNQDTVRDIPPVETLVFCGLQRPGHASLYCHPRVDETVIFTYSDWMHGTIKDHVDAAMERYREFTGLPDHRIPTPEVHGLSDAEPDDNGPDPSYPDEQDGPEDDHDQPKDEDTVNLPDGLSSEDLYRLEDLVRLSPTKNSELRDEWGLTSGKEVYQYLASNLSEYYRRNEEQLIVPTGHGRDLVEEQS
ncbi:hypothetical protein Har1131_17270 [Haloarcula sp. CBA1131]|nr:DUF5797 family protein [Haloarcula sp. CBA1131]KAA9400781.1 hypothetical protein Har1131_19125 [Haloarcula sp. CBA1131]KAA9404120.1 hypothetical protein Har1131_17270 [Haloarcula sp. CBA1131]